MALLARHHFILMDVSLADPNADTFVFAWIRLPNMRRHGQRTHLPELSAEACLSQIHKYTQLLEPSIISDCFMPLQMIPVLCAPSLGPDGRYVRSIEADVHAKGCVWTHLGPEFHNF